MTPSEEFVKSLCERSFLSLWVYPTPRSKDNKELCDLLVVCEPSIIIFSVKEIEFQDSTDFETAYQRWRSKAIKKSVAQIYGAERWIRAAEHVITVKGEKALTFPTIDRRIYRVAVAFGSKGKALIDSGDFGKGFVHTFDEASLSVIVRELDTITDFVEYLQRKEDFFVAGKTILQEGGEEDLLAYYLINNRTFPISPDCMIIASGTWDEFSQSEGYRNKKDLEQRSYAWDKLIEQQCSYFRDKKLLTKHSLEEFETAIRVMTKEDRFNRRALCETFFDFLMKNLHKDSARVITSMSGITYVFQVSDEKRWQEDRKAELIMRCMLARGIHKQNKIVIGIATERFRGPEADVSWDIVNYQLDEWTKESQHEFDSIQRETGYFKNVEEFTHEMHEYRAS